MNGSVCIVTAYVLYMCRCACAYGCLGVLVCGRVSVWACRCGCVDVKVCGH